MPRWSFQSLVNATEPAFSASFTFSTDIVSGISKVSGIGLSPSS